jgi:hypothetical protein
MPLRIARLLPLAPLALVTACAGQFTSLTSETYIEGGKSFLFGGEQPGEAEIAVRNAGRTRVTIFARRGAVDDSVTSLAPGATADVALPARTVGVFRNESATDSAVIRLVIRGDVRGAGMRYESR